MKKLPAVLYQSPGGIEPVRDWLRELPPKDRRLVGQDVAVVELGWPVGMPVCRSLGDGLWEVRIHLTDGKIGRVLFCITDGRRVLLHGLVKKSQKTPGKERTLARKRMKEVTS